MSVHARWGPPSPPWLIRIGAVGHQVEADPGVPVKRGKVERCPPEGVEGRHVGAGFDQRGDQRGMAKPGRMMQWRVTAGIGQPGVRAHADAGQQCRFLARPGRPHEPGLPRCVLPQPVCIRPPSPRLLYRHRHALEQRGVLCHGQPSHPLCQGAVNHRLVTVCQAPLVSTHQVPCGRPHGRVEPRRCKPQRRSTCGAPSCSRWRTCQTRSPNRPSTGATLSAWARANTCES